MAHKGFLQTLFNKPENSDVILIFNGTEYHLILSLVQQCAPLLYEDFKKQPKKIDWPDLTPEQVIENLSTIMSRSNKTTVTISHPAIRENIVRIVLQSMYGTTVLTSYDKLGELHWLSNRFGMPNLADRCVNIFNMVHVSKLDTLVEDYLRAIKEKALTEDLFRKYFIEKLKEILKEKILQLVPVLSYEVMTEILDKSKYDSDFNYMMIHTWSKNQSNEDHIQTLFLRIKLESLSLNLLLTKVKSNPYIPQVLYVAALESALVLNFFKLDIKKWAIQNNLNWGPDVCAHCAELGRLDLLQLARLNGCEWNHRTCTEAAKNGHFEVLKWARQNGCKWEMDTCGYAAEYGHLEILKWLRLNGCPWDEFTPIRAIEGGQFECLKWAHANGCKMDDIICDLALGYGHLEILKWAREIGCKWTHEMEILAKQKWPGEF